MKKMLMSLAVWLLVVGCGSNNNNNAPAIEDISASTDKNLPVSMVLPEKDVDGDKIRYEIVGKAINGNIGVIGNIMVYRPNEGFTGIEIVEYRADDGKVITPVKTVTIEVMPIANRAPVAEDYAIETNANNQAALALPLKDMDGDVLEYAIIDNAVNGSASINGGVITYVPNQDFSGADYFTYQASDGELLSEIKTVAVNVVFINSSPIILVGTMKNAKELDSYEHSFLGYDVNGDALLNTISVVDDSGVAMATPSWLVLNNETLTVSTSRIPLDAPRTLRFKVTTDDGQGGVAEAYAQWTIEDYATFNTTWVTTNIGSSDDNTIKMSAHFHPNNVVDWGDGVVEKDVKSGVVEHVYAVPGEYEVKMAGLYKADFSGIFVLEQNGKKLTKVTQWGDVQWQEMFYTFAYTENLQITALDVPDLSKVTLMYGAFLFAPGLVADLSAWDVSNVAVMSGLFYGTNFNGDISGWDVSNVVMAFSMFESSTFNQDISSWNTANMKNISNMFKNNVNFNQDISIWDVSNVTNMAGLFWGSNFNQDISAWDVSNVTDMTKMLTTAGVYATVNYDSLLNGWSQLPLQPSVTLNVNGNYTLANSATARAAIITNFSWTITDNGGI